MKHAMALSLRSLKLKTRMILILGFTALLQTGAIGLFALHYLNQSMDEQMGQRGLHVVHRHHGQQAAHHRGRGEEGRQVRIAQEDAGVGERPDREPGARARARRGRAAAGAPGDLARGLPQVVTCLLDTSK